MATDAGEDREIFSDALVDDENANANPGGADDQPLVQTRTAEDQAVSDAIRQIGRGVQPSIPTAPQQRQPAPGGAQPGAQPGGEGPEDRSTAGLLRALLDERERRQGLEGRLSRFETQEQERRRTEEAARVPLHERIFSEPDAAIAELTQQITGPLEQRIEQMRVQHDFALAGVRHADTFTDAWAAWFNKVGDGKDPETYFKIMKAPSPGEALVQWFKGEQRNSTIGDDLDAYNAKVVREAFEAQGLPVPPQYADAAGGAAAQQPQPRFDARAGQPQRDASGRFAPSQPQAQRFPTATSRMGQSGGGLADHDEDGSDSAIFDSGRPERGKAR